MTGRETRKIESEQLKGDTIILDPLQYGHTNALYIAVRDDSSIWQYTADQPGRSREAMGKYVAEALREQQEGTGLTYVITDKERKVLGVVRMYDARMEPNLREAKFGAWLLSEAQGRNIITEASYVLGSSLFERLGMDRIVFSINSENQQSIKATVKRGARRLGEERDKPPFAGAESRDSVIYEITRHDWNQQVKAYLESELPGSK